MRLPTTADDWHLVARTLRLVLTIPTYAAVALVGAVGSLSVFVFSQNVPLVTFALRGPLSLADRASLLAALYPFVGGAYGVVRGTILIAVSVLVGMNVAVAAYHFREHRVSVAGGGTSAIGLLLGTLGAGCAACGTAVLAGLLSLVGAAGLLTVLPLEGLEMSLLAALAVGLSLFWLADGMRGGEINGCPVDP